MASTYTTSLRLEKIQIGAQSGTWGTTENTQEDLREDAIAGTSTIVHDDSANDTATANSGTADEARNMFLNITGTTSADRNLVVPTSSKLYFIRNNTTGGFSITVKTTSGSGITVLNGDYQVLYCDGTNVVNAFNNLGASTTLAGVAIVDLSTAQTLTNKRMTTIELGHASDSTITRISAGLLAIEGDNIVTATATQTLTGKTIDANATGNVLSNIDIGNAIAASQAEAEAGTDATKLVTPLRVAQAIAALETATPTAFASGTKMLFQQTAAPTGWTKETTHNDKALRVVTGSVSSGGATAFGTVFGSSKVSGAHTLITSEMPSHTHTVGTRDYQGTSNSAVAKSSAIPTATQNSGSTGGGGSHTHTLSLDLHYVDIIIAEKD